MSVFGGFLSLFGICGFTSAIFGDQARLEEGMQEQREMMRNYLRDHGGKESDPLPRFLNDVTALRRLAAIVGMLTLFGGFSLVAIGQSVRGGSRSAALLGIFASCLLLVIFLLMAAMMTLSALIVPPIFACVFASVVPIGLLILQLIALVGVVRAAESDKPLHVRQAEQTMQSRLAAATFGLADYRPPPHPLRPSKASE